MLAKGKFRQPGEDDKKYELALKIMHTISIVNYIVCIFGAKSSLNQLLKYPWIAAFLRPIEYGLMTSQIRNYFARYINVVRSSFVMVVFILSYVAYFALLANKLFSTDIEGV